MASTARRLIAIAGGGIGGLCAALLLARQGFNIIVYEKALEPQPTGTGIQLSPNAFKILAELGLSKPLRTAGFTPDLIHIRSGLTDHIVSDFPLGETIQQRHGAPYLVIHRVDLMTVLQTACEQEPGVTIKYGMEIQDAAPHANGVTLLLRNDGLFDEQLVGALVGADGAWSTCRKFVPGSSEPRFTGTIAWRTLMNSTSAPNGSPTNSTDLWLGPNAHIVAYPIRQGQSINVVAITQWRSDTPPTRGWIKNPHHQERHKPFEYWHAFPRNLVNQNSDWGGWPIYAVDRIGALSEGPICLIGDAAHAMPPFAAQGGACAIEDAAVLAKCCSVFPDDLEDAFTSYARDRRKRITRIMKLSIQNRKIYHLAGSLASARDISLKLLGKTIVSKRMDWLYGWTVASSKAQNH